MLEVKKLLLKVKKIEHVEKAELVLKNLLKVIELGNTITLKDVEAAIKWPTIIQFIIY